MSRKSWISVTLLVIVLLALLAGTCIQFADDGTRAKLYGWLPGGAPAVEPGSTSRR